MTQCVRCHADTAEFYANDRTCKECRKALVRANRAKNLDYYQEYDRGRSFRADRVEARKQYQRSLTPEKKKRNAARGRLWAKRNADKRAAHIIVSNAIRDGRLQRQPCAVCGKRAQAHHEDYSMPLDVVWLCREHHGLRHREINEAKR